MILILGSPGEAHAASIAQRLRRRGERVLCFDTRQFPSRIRIALYPGADCAGYLLDASGARISIGDIGSVYWRCHMGTAIAPAVTESFQRDMAAREIESCVGSMFRMMSDCLWVNSPEAIEMHVCKGFQLQVLAARGLRIPRTLVSNDPEAVAEFYAQQSGRVIFKPVRGGAHTARMRDCDLAPERLCELAKAPVQFQELIEGVDIRAYVIGREVFAAEIRSSTLDFRDDPAAELVPIALPDAVSSDCLAVANALGLEMSGIDLRRTPDGEHVFLEGNPAPMFLHFEERTGYPIGDRLVDRLCAGR